MALKKKKSKRRKLPSKRKVFRVLQNLGQTLDKVKTIVIQVAITVMLMATVTELVRFSFRPINIDIDQAAVRRVLPLFVLFVGGIVAVALLLFIFILILKSRGTTSTVLKYRVTKAFHQALDQSSFNPKEIAKVYEQPYL